MSTLKKAFDLLTTHEKRRGLLILVLVVGMAMLEAAGVASVMPFLAILGDPGILNTNPILSALYTKAQGLGITTPDDFLVALGLVTFAFILISAAYRTFTYYAMNHFIEMRRHSIGSRLLETYLGQPYPFFLDRHSADMSKTILSEVDQLILNVFRPAYNMLANSLVLIAITALLVFVDPWLALLALGLLGGFYALVFFSVSRKLAQLGIVRVIANKKRFVAVGEAFGGIKIIKLLGREQSYLSRFYGPSKQVAANQVIFQTLNQVPTYLIEAIIFGAMLLLTLIMLISSGGLAGGALGGILPVLGMYAFASVRMHPALQIIYRGFASLRYGQAVVDSLCADLQNKSSFPLNHQYSTQPLKVLRNIELEHLSYTYPKASKAALVDLSLKIPVGGLLGIVGSTGSGKTTLMDIMLGLLRPTQGVIKVGGKVVTDENLRSWQRCLGHVPQEIFLTDSTISENIALGIPKDQIDHEQIVRCAQKAQVHDFIIQELPEQYSTLVGERGVRLSGGQRQRIGIARALYHDPDVLVFDEATSALDTVTETAVMDAIDALVHQKTIILIAHRLSTVRKCDQIVLLEQGRLKAKGSYEELINDSEQFKNMAIHA